MKFGFGLKIIMLINCNQREWQYVKIFQSRVLFACHFGFKKIKLPSIFECNREILIIKNILWFLIGVEDYFLDVSFKIFHIWVHKRVMIVIINFIRNILEASQASKTSMLLLSLFFHFCALKSPNTFRTTVTNGKMEEFPRKAWPPTSFSICRIASFKLTTTLVYLARDKVWDMGVAHLQEQIFRTSKVLRRLGKRENEDWKTSK